MNTLFTSDTHFFHKKALAWRGFETVEAMNDALGERWNARVGPRDLVYHLGDLSFGSPEDTACLLAQLHGTILLVPGNHDKLPLVEKTIKLLEGLPQARQRNLIGKLRVLPPLLTVKVPEHQPGGETLVHRFVLCHFPMLVWDRAHYGVPHLHGHSHGYCVYPEHRHRKPKMMDVGIDAPGTGMAPVPLSHVLYQMDSRTYIQHDHHAPKEEAHE